LPDIKPSPSHADHNETFDIGRSLTVAAPPLKLQESSS
jgi:hypothetical protein